MTQSELEVIQWRYIVEYIKERREEKKVKRMNKYLAHVKKISVVQLGFQLQPEIES